MVDMSQRWEASQCQHIGNISVLLPAPRPAAMSLATCLEHIEHHWQEHGHMAALWQAWPRIAGAELARHCRPLQWQAGMLSVGAPPGPWLQALQYNRHQLLGALRGAGFRVRDLRLQQQIPKPLPTSGAALEKEIWFAHPCRPGSDGLAECPRCSRPAPSGEVKRWGQCSFCQSAALQTPATIIQ